MTRPNDFADDIYVKSHIARDLLQNAALFKTDKLVIWEYVSNGLQYVDEGTNPEVRVALDSKRKKIVISDNGRGMDWNGLKNFFVMHGENVDRREGRPGRGRFGTGKSAAFGIAEILRVSTVRNGKLSEVELHRKDIEVMNSENPIPVSVIQREIPIAQPNGTVIEIRGIHLRTFNQPAISKYIERHLAKWRNARVIVNNQICEFVEPPTSWTRVYQPEGPLADKLGKIDLVIKVASAPLEEELRGISIYSKGVWYETTLAGNEGRDMSQYIFGEIDVPQLDEDRSPIPPFDLSRSMQLNPSNELVQSIYAFIGRKVDEVRRELLKAERERKAGEEAKRLAKQAEAIARIINDDFYDFRESIARVKSKGGAGFDSGGASPGGLNLDNLVYGKEEPAIIISPSGDSGSEGGNKTRGKEPRTLRPLVAPANSEEERLGAPAGGKPNQRIARGGFSVQFKPMGWDEARALYMREDRTIYVNLEHPQLKAARGGNPIDDPVFLRIAYEVAFSEYAIALAHELNLNDEYIDTSDPIVSIRETINRIARRAAHLYSAPNL